MSPSPCEGEVGRGRKTRSIITSFEWESELECYTPLNPLSRGDFWWAFITTNELQNKPLGEMRDWWVTGRSSSEQGRGSTYGINAISISSGDFCATFGRSKVVSRWLYGAELQWEYSAAELRNKVFELLPFRRGGRSFADHEIARVVFASLTSIHTKTAERQVEIQGQKR